jgi:hypothetical protein
MRAFTKVIVDYTGCVQLRGPGEMGGFAWTCSMVASLAGCFLATAAYFASVEEGEAVMEEHLAWTMVGCLCLAWIFFFVFFLLVIRTDYIWTYFSFQTGAAWVQSRFLEGRGDEVKKGIHKFNKKLWRGIRGEVKDWTLENWERWEEEQPEWFNEAWKLSVDDDMIPADSLAEMNGAGGASSRRRRSSLGDVLGATGGGGGGAQ